MRWVWARHVLRKVAQAVGGGGGWSSYARVQKPTPRGGLSGQKAIVQRRGFAWTPNHLSGTQIAGKPTPGGASPCRDHLVFVKKKPGWPWLGGRFLLKASQCPPPP